MFRCPETMISCVKAKNDGNQHFGDYKPFVQELVSSSHTAVSQNICSVQSSISLSPSQAEVPLCQIQSDHIATVESEIRRKQHCQCQSYSQFLSQEPL